MKSKNYIKSIVFALLVLTSFANAQNQCPTPTGITVINITNNSATVSWNAVPGALIYNVRYRQSPAPNNTWLTVTTQTTSVNISNLVSNSLYEYQVQTGCSGLNGAIILSSFSPLDYFTTLGGGNVCPVPAGLFANNITNTSAKLNWGSTGASSYKLRYRIIGSLTWLSANATANHKTIGSLVSGANYQWQVRSVCIAPSGVITKSAWSSMSNFTTTSANSCPAPTNLTAASTGTGTVALTWSATNALYYNIRYRSANTALWTSTTSNTNSKVLTGLPSNAAYEWQVQSACANLGAIILSPWSASAYFQSLKPFNVNPNPANNVLHVSYESAMRQDVTVVINDFYGNKLQSSKANFESGNNQLDVDVSNLKNGMYYIELHTSNGIETQKIFVQH